jgi:hypothetical protein
MSVNQRPESVLWTRDPKPFGVVGARNQHRPSSLPPCVLPPCRRLWLMGFMPFFNPVLFGHDLALVSFDVYDSPHQDPTNTRLLFTPCGWRPWTRHPFPWEKSTAVWRAHRVSPRHALRWCAWTTACLRPKSSRCPTHRGSTARPTRASSVQRIYAPGESAPHRTRSPGRGSHGPGVGIEGCQSLPRYGGHAERLWHHPRRPTASPNRDTPEDMLPLELISPPTSRRSCFASHQGVRWCVFCARLLPCPTQEPTPPEDVLSRGTRSRRPWRSSEDLLPRLPVYATYHEETQWGGVRHKTLQFPTCHTVTPATSSSPHPAWCEGKR